MDHYKQINDIYAESLARYKNQDKKATNFISFLGQTLNNEQLYPGALFHLQASPVAGSKDPITKYFRPVAWLFTANFLFGDSDHSVIRTHCRIHFEGDDMHLGLSEGDRTFIMPGQLSDFMDHVFGAASKKIQEDGWDIDKPIDMTFGS